MNAQNGPRSDSGVYGDTGGLGIAPSPLSDGFSDIEREEYNQILEAEEQDFWDNWLSSHCQLHGCELLGCGECPCCQQEEREERRVDL